MPIIWRPSRRFIACLTLLFACWAGVFLYYNATRGRVVPRSRASRLQRLTGKAAGIRDEIHGGTRAILAETREFMLDYPDSNDAGLSMTVAMAEAAQVNPDWNFVADTIEHCALQVVNGVTGRDLVRGDFERLNFQFGDSEIQFYARRMQAAGWPQPFVAADIDGDGTKDIVLSVPTERPGVTLLLRHTRQGWVSNRLAVGAPVMAIWTFPISPKGPTAIVLGSLANSAYDPNLLLDVFVWQHGRVNSVLSTQIPHGWQWDHRDREGSGAQTIRVVTRTSSPSWSSTDPHYNILYRWNGVEYVKTSSTWPADLQEIGAVVRAGLDRLDSGRFADAVLTLRQSLLIRPGQYENAASEHSIAEYGIGIALAMQGDYSGSVSAMNASISAADPADSKPAGDDLVVEGNASVPAMASRFLKNAASAQELPGGLASVGQALRVLEKLANEAPADALPKSLISTAHIKLDRFQEAALTGDSGPEQITSVSWRYGSAVLAWKRERSKWRIHVLAYGIQGKPPKENGLYGIPSGLWCYFPRPPALQIWPVATGVSLAGVTSGVHPQVQISGSSSRFSVSGAVHWDGAEFVSKQAEPRAPHFSEDLRDIEARLFSERRFRSSLDELNSLEDRVERSSLSEDDQADLLHEIYYHEAVCYRKLGDLRHAEVILSALQRSDPDSPWGNLAGSWLGGTGLPGMPIRWGEWMPRLRW